MDIKICESNILSEIEWISLSKGFNKVFNKNFDVAYFKQKYLGSNTGNGIHALVVDNDGRVCGNITIIPQVYLVQGIFNKVGLVVDVFILEEYRNDPFMLRRMYLKLKTYLVEKGFYAVVAVPNIVAYPYWKSVVKWKDIGDLDYWVLPVRLGNVLGKYRILNYFSIVFVYILLFLNLLIFWFVNLKKVQREISLVKDVEFYRWRFINVHNVYNCSNSVSYTRSINESNVRTTYLLDSLDNKCRFSFRSLCSGIRKILRNENPDLIIYVGDLSFFQLLLFRIPKKFQPKRLPLMCDPLQEVCEPFYNISNWDFGLVNYDVR